MAKISNSKLKSHLENLKFGPLLFMIMVSIFAIIVVVVIGSMAFKSLLININRAVADSPPSTLAQGGVNFDALDVIALKLGIEIPARNIPTAKFLEENSIPLIFNFSTIRPQISIGEIAPIFLNVFDPDGDPLIATWTSSGGSITTLGPLGPAQWVAPGEIGEYTISVLVTDNKPGHQPVPANFTISVIQGIPRDVTPEELPSYTTRLVGLVKEEGLGEIFIVKAEGSTLYKRLLVAQEVIAYYPDLDLNSIQTVPKGTLTDYKISSWVRGEEQKKVYQVNPSGTKQWLNMTFEEFIARGGSEEAIFTVNDTEIGFYPNGANITP